MDSVEPAAANENHPSTVTMMQDPKMRAEVSERVGKVLKKYPRAHSNVYDLVTAANEFIDTYKLDTGDKTPGKP